MTSNSELQRFDKLFVSLRYYLIGMASADPRYKNTLEMLEFAKDIHTGVRKDGFTPEFQHQIEIAHYIRTIGSSLINPAMVIGICLGHDILEDYSAIAPFVTLEELASHVGNEMADECMILSKEYQGKKLDTRTYYTNLQNSPHGSIAKGGDRIHNQNSMTNVFSNEKQLSYVKETEDFVLPMIKAARRKHFSQEPAYENIKFVLRSQISFVKAYVVSPAQ